MKPSCGNISIYSLRVGAVTNNGSVNIGETFHYAHTANSKSQGTHNAFGDAAPSKSAMQNTYVDPDTNDMCQLSSGSGSN